MAKWCSGIGREFGEHVQNPRVCSNCIETVGRDDSEWMFRQLFGLYLNLRLKRQRRRELFQPETVFLF